MRVLSLHPAMTELMFAIGASGLLVGRTDECRYPEAATKIPSIGSKDDASEVLVDVFEPNLVLCGPDQDVLAAGLKQAYRVFQFAPNSLDEMFAMAGQLGDMLGKQVETDMVIHDTRIILNRLREKSEKFHPIRIYCEVQHNAAVGANGYIAEILKFANATVFDGVPTPELLQEFDPQMIISSVPGEREFNFELLASRDGWEKLNAVRYERLFSIPGELLHTPGPRLQEGIKLLAKYTHGLDLENGRTSGTS